MQDAGKPGGCEKITEEKLRNLQKSLSLKLLQLPKQGGELALQIDRIRTRKS
jgi:hypothetical protein